VPIGVLVCICGVVFFESHFGDKKMPDHIHQEMVQYFHHEGANMAIGTSASSISANFDVIQNKNFKL
jgi:hypothetical protein